MNAFDLHVVCDCADPDRVSRFWMEALGGYDFPFGVPEGFAGWDEWADATRMDSPDGFHLIMQDPEGNEFCLA